MSDISYVNEESSERAIEFQSRFQVLPPEAGILFVSVKPLPVLGGKVITYEVLLGIDKRFEEATGLAIIKKVLEKEIDSGEFGISAAIHRGVRGSGRDQNPEGPYSSSTQKNDAI